VCWWTGWKNKKLPAHNFHNNKHINTYMISNHKLLFLLFIICFICLVSNNVLVSNFSTLENIQVIFPPPPPPLETLNPPPPPHCRYENSPLKNSIYVYSGELSSNRSPYHFHRISEKLKKAPKKVHYDPKSPFAQFALEMVVHDIITHPSNCLTTSDPTLAKLFYVPFFSDMEFRIGLDGVQKELNREITPHGDALMSAMIGTEEGYAKWEKTWGHPSTFWRRHKGADHIVVIAAPLSGFTHPQSRRGSYHYIHTQLQLTRTIVLSVEQSTTFIRDYPHCSRKNIVLPYPNHDGEWLRGDFSQSKDQSKDQSKALLFYSGGNHGECVPLRKMINAEASCYTSEQNANANANANKKQPHHVGLSSATFCPAPHGDSPSAKRMYDAVISGCIPVVLSTDFVWALTTDALGDKATSKLSPDDFSMR